MIKRLAAALGASLWVQTPSALVFGRHATAALLVHWPSVAEWWELVEAHLEYPEPSPCEECGHLVAHGQASAQILAPDIGEVRVTLYLLGHEHFGNDAPKTVYLVESIVLVSGEVEPSLLAESSLRFSSVLTPSSDRVAALPEVEQGGELDAYLNSLSYRLRTPLTSVLGYSQMLLEEDFAVDATANHLLQQIDQAGRQAIDVVNELELHLVRERTRRKLASTLRKVSMIMAGSSELDDVVARVYQCIAQIIHFDRSHLLWIRDGFLELARSPRAEEPSVGEPRWAADQYPYAQVMQALPEMQYISEVDHGLLSEDVGIDPGCKSWACVPLMGADGPFALITLESDRPDAYSDLECELLDVFGHHASLALSNAHQHGETRKLAEVDRLTSALSRGYFLELAQKRFDEAIERDEPLSLVFFDIDFFKQVNDTYGHAAGDAALKTVVDQCQLALRPVDLVGRYGGEEFLILLPRVACDAALVIADRVRRRIALTQVETKTARFNVTISAGVATLDPARDADIQPLIERADLALYRAKAEGRNQVNVEEPETLDLSHLETYAEQGADESSSA